MALSQEERNLVRQLWSRGPAVLIDNGFSSEEMRIFVERSDVQSEMALLDEEFKHSKIIEARSRYITQRNISRLADGAAAVLARAMAGPEYARHPDTGDILNDAHGHPILRRAEPNPNQVRAAKTVLDSMGLTDQKIQIEARSGDFNVRVLVDAQQEAPEIEHDPSHATEEERALSRERVRNTIEQIAERLPEIRTRAYEKLGMSPPKRKVARKKAAKKTSKKAARKKAAKKATRRGK